MLSIETLVHGRVGSFRPFFLQSVYLDELLQQLTSLDIGSHVSHHFVMLMTLASSTLRTLQECGLSAIMQLIYRFSLVDYSKLDLLLNHVFILCHLIQFFLTPSPTLGIVHLKIVQTSREPHLKCAKKANIINFSFSSCDS